MKFLNKTLHPVLENLVENFENKNFRLMFLMNIALLEEMKNAFDFADDGSRENGYFINVAIESLTKLAEKQNHCSNKAKVFEYCISSYKQKIFEGWVCHLGILHIAGDLVAKESEADIMLDCVEAVKGEYEMESEQYTLSENPSA